jgi:hypothetical protein
LSEPPRHPPDLHIEEVLTRALQEAQKIYHCTTERYKIATRDGHPAPAELTAIQSEALENYRQALDVFNRFIVTGKVGDDPEKLRLETRQAFAEYEAMYGKTDSPTDN